MNGLLQKLFNSHSDIVTVYYGGTSLFGFQLGLFELFRKGIPARSVVYVDDLERAEIQACAHAVIELALHAEGIPLICKAKISRSNLMPLGKDWQGKEHYEVIKAQVACSGPWVVVDKDAKIAAFKEELGIEAEASIAKGKIRRSSSH